MNPLNPCSPFSARLCAVPFLVAQLFVSAAWCQTPPTAGSLLNEASKAGRVNPPLTGLSADEPVLETPARTSIQMPEGMTVKVSGFQITGAVSFAESELQALVAPWVGKSLSINALNEAAGALTRHYQSKGYVLSYAYLPAQKIADGTIQIAVLEGRIDDIQIVTAQQVRLQDEVVHAHVEGLTQAATVAQPEIERRLLLLNDIPGVVARASFAPGASTGGADLVVTVAEDEPLTTTLEANNHGSATTGEYLLSASFHFKDLFGLGDSTRAKLVASHTGDMVNAVVNTRVPVGGNGWTVGGGASRLSYALGGNFSKLGGVGEATAFNLNTGYPLIRSFQKNLNFQANIDNKSLRDEIQLTGIISPKENTVVTTGLSYDQRDAWQGGGNIAASFSLVQGQLTLKDSTQLATDRQGLQTAGQFSKLGFDLSRQQLLSGPWSLMLRVAGQMADKNLDSSEKFSLTGPGGVRAYAAGDFAVDEGRYTDLQLRYNQPYVGGALLWSVFVDNGWGRINVNPLAGVTDNEVSLLGAGLGLQWSAGPDLGVNATVAWRSSNSPALGGWGDAPRLYLQLFKNL